MRDPGCSRPHSAKGLSEGACPGSCCRQGGCGGSVLLCSGVLAQPELKAKTVCGLPGSSSVRSVKSCSSEPETGRQKPLDLRTTQPNSLLSAHRQCCLPGQTRGFLSQSCFHPFFITLAVLGCSRIAAVPGAWLGWVFPSWFLSRLMGEGCRQPPALGRSQPLSGEYFQAASWSVSWAGVPRARLDGSQGWSPSAASSPRARTHHSGAEPRHVRQRRPCAERPGGQRGVRSRVPHSLLPTCTRARIPTAAVQ